VWWDYAGTLLAARAGASGSWSAPTMLSSSGEPQHPWWTADHDGRVTAVWNTPYGALYAARFAAGGWSPPVQISSDSAAGWRPRCDGDAHGRIMVAWTQSETASASGWGTYFDGDAWRTASAFETGGFEYPVADVGLDATGEALAVWPQGDPALNGVIRARHYSPATGWSPTVTEIAQQQGLGMEARVNVAASGRAMALWTLMDITGGNRTLWTAAYE
jgi:hypothetical protein